MCKHDLCLVKLVTMKATAQLLYSCVLLATCAITAGGQQRHLHADVPHFLNDFFVPAVELSRGVAYYGTSARIRRALHEVEEGRKIAVTVIGGSIAAGGGALIDGQPFTAWARKWSDQYFPGRFEWLNRALGATTTVYMSICVNNHVPPETDVVVIDYTLNNRDFWKAGWDFNNDKTRSFERLVRSLLNYPKRPAVLLIHAFSYADGFPHRGAFWGGSVERDTPEFSLYYDLPAVSVKGCCYQLMQSNASGYRVDANVRDLPKGAPIEDKQQFFYFDNVHPYGLTGHRVMGDLLAYYLQNVYLGLQYQPWNEAEMAIINKPLPNPMVPDNFESTSSKCHQGEALVQIVQDKTGFEWIDESRVAGRHKFGYVSTTVGDHLTLVVDTSVTAGSNAQSSDVGMVTFQIAYLSSYEHMGVASVACIAGCTCNSTTFDSHTTNKFSLWSLHLFGVTPHPQCKIAVTNTPETSSGEHKIKLLGVMISEEKGNVVGTIV